MKNPPLLLIQVIIGLISFSILLRFFMQVQDVETVYAMFASAFLGYIIKKVADMEFNK